MEFSYKTNLTLHVDEQLSHCFLTLFDYLWFTRVGVCLALRIFPTCFIHSSDCPLQIAQKVMHQYTPWQMGSCVTPPPLSCNLHRTLTGPQDEEMQLLSARKVNNTSR